MKKILAYLILFLPASLYAQSYQKDLLGACTPDQLTKEPHSNWFVQNYDSYVPNIEFVEKLKTRDLSDFQINIIFGSWCGDSKREVPRMLKLLSQVSFPERNVRLIGVDDSLTVYKQSPGHEERGLGIYRVPTFIVSQNGTEVGRIVEYPVETLERDLLQLISGSNYTSNYYGYPLISTWLKSHLLTDANVSVRGLAAQLRSRIQNESELNSCGYVLLADGKIQEGITILRINAYLFPESVACLINLADAYVMGAMEDRAITALEHALKLEPDNQRILEKLNPVKNP